MNKTQALNKAIKLWGKGAGVQDRGAKWATGPDVRAEAKAKLAAMPRQWLDVEPTPTDDQTIGELKAWQARHRVWADEKRALAAVCHTYRFQVGAVAMGMFFEIKGEGDTWEEAFAKATK